MAHRMMVELRFTHGCMPWLAPSAKVIAMTQPLSDVYRYIVKELAPSAHKPDEPSLTIVCEPLGVPGKSSKSGTLTLHLQDGTTPAEAQVIAHTLQSKVKAVCHVQAPTDTTT